MGNAEICNEEDDLLLWDVPDFFSCGLKRCRGERDPQGLDSVRMEAPEGYIEVLCSEFPDYLSSVAHEAAKEQLPLLRYFIKTDELPLLRAGEFDRISGHVYVVWIQRESFLGRPVRELLDGMHRESVTPLGVGAAASAMALLDEEGRGEVPRMLGMIDKGAGYATFAFVNTMGLFLGQSGSDAKPMSIAFVCKETASRLLGIIFIQPADSPAGLVGGLQQAVTYMQQHGESVLAAPASAECRVLPCRKNPDPPSMRSG